jgi:hypothetical protein
MGTNVGGLKPQTGGSSGFHSDNAISVGFGPLSYWLRHNGGLRLWLAEVEVSTKGSRHRMDAALKNTNRHRALILDIFSSASLTYRANFSSP